MEKNVDTATTEANIVEQLDLLISREKGMLLNSLHDHGRLEDKLGRFMGNLQQQINEVLETGNADRSVTTESSEEAEEAMRMLEDEYSNYNITQANNIINHKRPKSDMIKQSLAGSALAIGVFWFSMPQVWQEQVDVAFNKVISDVQQMANSNKPAELIGNVVETAKAGAVEMVEQAVSSVEIAKEEAVEIVELAVKAVGAPAVEDPASVMPVSNEIQGELVAAVKEPVLNEVKPVAASKVLSLLDHGSEPEPVAKVKEPETVIGQRLTVTAHVGNARNIPDNKGKRVTRIKMGDVVTKLNEQLGWYQVKLENGTVAWVYKTVFAPRLQVLVGVGNVRFEPSGKSRILARINHGDFVTKIDEKNGWYLVKLDSGIRAWGHHSIF